VRILEVLAVEPASARALSVSLNVPLGDASYHLRVLDRECELLRLAKVRDRRGAREKIFILDQGAFRDLIDWSALPPFLDEALKGAALKGFVNAAASAIDGGALESDISTLCWRPVALDPVGWNRVRAALAHAEEEIRAAVDDSVALLQSKEKPVHAVVGLAAFEAPQNAMARDPQ
jgi:hypothetical protein